MTLEFLLPPDIALVADIETDSKTRSLQDLRLAAKKGGAVNGSSAFYFTRRGRAVFRAGSASLSDLLEEAIEHEGTQDVEELPDGEGHVVWTEPAMLMAVTQALAQAFKLDVLESEIVWAANEDTMVAVDSAEVAESLDSLFASLQDHPEVKGLYANVRKGSVSEDLWERVVRSLDQ
jgi:transcriptional/translational regulatory protein YebC/TACO1